MTQLWFFENVNLFDILCPHKTKNIQQKHSFHTFKKEEFIYFEGDSAEQIFLIANGRVKIGTYSEDGNEFIKAILGRGEIFGELIILGEDKRQDFAQALDNNTMVCPMSLQDLENLMKGNRQLSLKIHKILNLRFKKLERRLELLIFKDVKTRLREFIKDLAKEKGKQKGEETFVENYLTHKDIASLVGSSRQTVTTLLNEMESDQKIRFEKKNFYIKNL
jgi:CRP/FNR family transcriptional regulator, cyclic AMP receptor protein